MLPTDTVVVIVVVVFPLLCSSAWGSWQTRLQQHQVLHALEKRALEDKALALLRRVKKWANKTPNNIYIFICNSI